MNKNQCWSNYSEFYQRSGYASFPQEHRISSGQHYFRMIKVQQGAHSFSDPAVSESLVALTLQTDPNCTWAWSFGNQSFRHNSRPGSMLMVPANTNSMWQVNARRTLLVLALPNTTVRKILNGACPENINKLFSPLTQTVWEKPLVEQMMIRLWNSAVSSSLAHRVLADGLITSILAELLIMSEVLLPQHAAIALPQWRLTRVKTYVQDHLSAEISLNDLANTAGLSVRHFTRNFQKEVGETPLRWVMKVRTEHAMELLTQTDLSISEIAHACGFSSQSHLTTSLRKQSGQTPLRWRHLSRN